MRNWFLSIDGAITLSVIALLTFFGRAFLDWRYESSNLGSAGSLLETIYMLGHVAFMGGWIWAMLAAIRGSRRGLIVCLILALWLNIGFALGTYLFWCPPSSCIGFPHLWTWNSAHLISGLLASIAMVFQLSQKKAAG